VLAANPIASALAPWFTAGENLVKAAFLDQRRRELSPDWERSLGRTVAALRANVGPDVGDPRLTALIRELSLRSGEFWQLWARHDVRPKGSGTTVMLHPQVGRFELSYTKFPIPETDRQTLPVYCAAPGSPGERALALLATTTVREREPERTLRD
jgi:MmyB-like transcription regulator ligand binding domain